MLFCFFARTEIINGREVTKKVLPPPKELVQGSSGRLRLKSSRAFDDLVTGGEKITAVAQCRFLYGNSHASLDDQDGYLSFSCRSGYEAVLLPGHHTDFRLRCVLTLQGSGKCGLVLRINEEGDGYYLALDLIKGVAQIRAMGREPDARLRTLLPLRAASGCSLPGGAAGELADRSCRARHVS